MRLNLDRRVFLERDGLLDQILDCFDRALIVDTNKRILFFSESSSRFSGHKKQEVIGRNIDELIAANGFDNVLKNGESDRGILLNMDGNLGIAAHIPVYDGKELLGVVGIVYFNRISSINKILAEAPELGNNEYMNVYQSLSRRIGSYSFEDYIGETPVVRDMIAKTRRAAESNLPILFIGETGTGKEILANAVHNHHRKTQNHPFVKINCSAIPGELLESELFGHEKGAFTGASSTKKGKFEVANGGSILLDEIGDMSLTMQAKLLRLLEEREFERVGGNELIRTNARVIASTNRNLGLGCREKWFREDLYFRLNALEIHVPPLRDRLEDVPLLVGHIVSDTQVNIRFSDSALTSMMRYPWPGNVRQLRNVVHRFGVMNPGETMSKEAVEAVLMQMGVQESSVGPVASAVPFRTEPLHLLERRAIENALSEFKGNKSLAAAALAISRSTLLRKLKELGVN